MHLSEHALKAVGGAVVAAGSYSINLLGQVANNTPDWIDAVDKPIGYAALAYAVFHLWTELRAERKARIDDRDAFIKTLRDDAAKGDESRTALLKATVEQTGEFKALRREISRKGLHVPKEGED